MVSGESNPDQLYAYVYGQPIDAEQAQHQSEELQSQLAMAEDRRNVEEAERVERELEALYEAHPSLRDADITLS
jgi:hypothetical protein